MQGIVLNPPPPKAHRRAQTARPAISELSSLISAQGRSGAGRTGEREWVGVARGYLITIRSLIPLKRDCEECARYAFSRAIKETVFVWPLAP